MAKAMFYHTFALSAEDEDRLQRLTGNKVKIIEIVKAGLNLQSERFRLTDEDKHVQGNVSGQDGTQTQQGS